MRRDLQDLLFHFYDSGVNVDESARVLLMLGADKITLPDHLSGDLFSDHKAVLGDVPYFDLTEQDPYSHIFLAIPKNMIEARYMLARACRILRKGGVISVAAMNDAGGGRISKLMASFGLSDLQVYSKHKGRCVCGLAHQLDENAIHEALERGAMQHVAAIDGYSQPGIFGWDKVDLGSQILLQYLPDDLRGAGADFGCGYGYLSRTILARFSDLSFIAIDEDYRAVEASKKNIVSFDARWLDITRDPLPSDLDFIVMNPPFHQGKGQDIALGRSFIARAAQCLKKNGRLFMVANAHLPYEAALAQHFKNVSKLHEGQGFKIYQAAL